MTATLLSDDRWLFVDPGKTLSCYDGSAGVQAQRRLRHNGIGKDRQATPQASRPANTEDYADIVSDDDRTVFIEDN